MLYRLHDNLGPLKDGRVLPKGSLQPLSELTVKAREILLEKGFITEWKSPPLEILPGWRRRAAVLERAGIVTVNELLSANLDKVADQLHISAESLIESAEEARQLTFIV